MNVAGQLPIQIDRRATFNMQVKVTEDDGTTPIDLTNYTFAAEMRADFDEDVSAEFAVTPVDLVNGVISLIMTSDLTDILPFDRGVYDLRMVDAAGEPTYLIRGVVTVNPYVTR